MCKLIVQDINPKAEFVVKESLKDYPLIKVVRNVFGASEGMSAIEDNYVDVLICTHVLCCVTDPMKVCKEMARVLKPEGKLYIMEHIQSRSSVVVKLLQWTINPFWSPLTAGCQLNRDPSSSFKEAGFKTVDNLRYTNLVNIPFTLSPQLFGTLTK